MSTEANDDIEQIAELSKTFSALPAVEKAIFLSRAGHWSTVVARGAYVVDYDQPDGVVLKNANEFMHQLTSYIRHVLQGSDAEFEKAMVGRLLQEPGFDVPKLQSFLTPKP